MKYIILSILFLTSLVHAELTLPPKAKELQYLDRLELLRDPGFEMGGGVDGGSAGVSYQTSGGSNTIVGRSISWNPSGADTLTLQGRETNKRIKLKEGTSGYIGASCFVSGNDSTHTYKLQIYNLTDSVVLGEIDLSIGDAYFFRYQKILDALVINSVDTEYELRITAAANEANIYIDECSFQFKQKADVGTFNGPMKSVTVTGSWTTNTTYSAFMANQGEFAYFDVFVSLSGAPNSTTLNINLPSGMIIDTNRLKINSENISALESIGEARDSGNGSARIFARYVGTNTSVQIGYLQSATSIAGVTQSVPHTYGSGDSLNIKFKVPIVGLDAGNTITNEQVDWRVDANISGANVPLSSSAVTSYTGIENGSLTLTNNTSKGSLTNVMIPCSSTNDSNGTTCSAGNESVGIAFTPPTAGWVKVCVALGYKNVASSLDNEATFQIVKTPNNAQTISSEGGSRILMGGNTGAGNDSFTDGNQICGNFFLDSISKHTFRLFYEKQFSTVGTAGYIMADANTSAGQRDIHWTVEPLVKYGNVIQQPNRTTTKYLSSNLTSNTTDIASLRFTNLIVGKMYKVTGNVFLMGSGNEYFDIIHDSVNRGRVQESSAGSGYAINSIPFIATTTTVTFNYSIATGAGNLQGNGSASATYVTLTELNNTVPGNF